MFSILLQRYNIILRPPRIRSKKELPPVLPLGTNRRGISQGSPKRALETASVSHDEEHQHAVISFADGAKVSLRSSASQPDRQEIANKTLILLQRYEEIDIMSIQPVGMSGLLFTKQAIQELLGSTVAFLQLMFLAELLEGFLILC